MNYIKGLEPDELRTVYRDHIRGDFPRGERRPLFAMERMRKAGRYDCYGFYNGEKLLAYACCILAESGSYALLDYFAVIPELRDRGIGSEFLRGLRGNVSAKRGMFIEAESPDAAKSEQERQVRERRIRFYLSNGAEQTNSGCLLFGVDYNILFITTNNAANEKDMEQLHHAVEALYQELYGRAYGRLCKPYCKGNAGEAPVCR